MKPEDFGNLWQSCCLLMGTVPDKPSYLDDSKADSLLP